VGAAYRLGKMEMVIKIVIGTGNAAATRDTHSDVNIEDVPCVSQGKPDSDSHAVRPAFFMNKGLCAKTILLV
jgi:hypothetical protein|tara:strand:+ start:801 stop:1016 length:216 start_codon:yes stop_codon:yes gene_type:complete